MAYVEDHLGSPGSACYFNGETSQLQLPNLEILKPNFPMSIAFWIKYDSDDFLHQVVFNTSYEEDVNTGLFFMAQSNTGNFAVGFGNGANSYSSSSRRSFVSNSTLEVGVWHHVVIIIEGPDSMSIVVDCVDNGGEYSGSATEIVYSDLPGIVGRHDFNTGFEGPFFKGAISDFRFYSRALSQNEIENICTVPTVGISNNSNFEFDKLKVFPNPTTGKITLGLNTPSHTNKYIDRVEVIDLLGKLYYEKHYERTKKTDVNLVFLERGVYLVKIFEGDKVYIKRLVING